MKRFSICVQRTGKILLMFLGAVALVMMILAFTSAPFWIRYHLGTKLSGISGFPDYIVILGGGGIPSESGLIRTYYGARAALEFPAAKVIIALPGNTADSTSSLNLMKRELMIRGVAPERILLEDSGANTRAEALEIKKIIQADVGDTLPETRGIPFDSVGPNDLSGSRLLLITSPEHLYRSVLTFRKVGFSETDGIAAFERALEADFSFSARKLGGKSWVPDVGESTALRYRFWNYLEYELVILREWMAIAYYWLMGWI